MNTPLTVLLVDDDPISLLLLERSLAAKDCIVRSVPTAQEAMRVLERQSVQIVIADWVMPEMSGIELCRWVRAKPLQRPLHFVMLTVHSDPARLVEAFEAGVDDFLSKPLDESELLARLRAWGRFVRLQEDLTARHREAQRLNDELISANARLEELATQDELTLLPNRRAAMRRLAEQWTIALRYAQPLSCLLIDIDHFKQFNDHYGHETGDDVLRQVATAIRSSIRLADAAFRLGGDEFLVLCPNSAATEAAACAERCRIAVAAHPPTTPAPHLSSTISIGLAEISPAMTTPRDLLRAADQALYAAKGAGRNVTHAAAAAHSLSEIVLQNID
jgi:diguanylate cyclase (GGDEF)-like protein